MVTVLLNSVDQLGERRQFTLGALGLGEALDMAYSLISKEHGVVDVTLIDQKTFIKLPLDVFDGHSFKASLNQLEREWQHILDQPILDRSAQHALQIRLVQVRIEQNDANIAFLESTIVMLELRLSIYGPTISLENLNRLEHVIIRYRALLSNAHDRKEKNRQRLLKLIE